MLQIKSLTITHKKDLRTIVRDFNLVLNSGDKAVLIGEEGNGKSTLLKWIFDPALIENYVEADGIRTSQGELVGYLPQELSEEDKKKTVYEFFSGLASSTIFPSTKSTPVLVPIITLSLGIDCKASPTASSL